MRSLSRVDWTAIGVVVAVLTLLVGIMAWRFPQSPPTGSTGGHGEDLKRKQASIGDPGAPATSAPMSTPPVRNTGRVDIGSDALDLNAAPGDVRWGIGETPHGEPDVVDFRNGVFTIRSSLFRPPAQLDAGYVSCSKATAYPEPQITVAAKDLEGRTYCVRLQSGRYATLEVAESSRTTATLELTTWELG